MSQATTFIGSDHGGFALKQHLLVYASQWTDRQIEDCGASQLDPDDDYPQYALAVAERVAQAADTAKGIVLCRSGGGVIIVANKVPKIRAVLVRTVEEVRHAIEHNNANVIGIAADWTPQQEAEQIVEIFLSQQFSGQERHLRRLKQITDIEHKYMVSNK